jgi:hypothetical protein
LAPAWTPADRRGNPWTFPTARITADHVIRNVLPQLQHAGQVLPTTHKVQYCVRFSKILSCRKNSWRANNSVQDRAPKVLSYNHTCRPPAEALSRRRTAMRHRTTTLSSSSTMDSSLLWRKESFQEAARDHGCQLPRRSCSMPHASCDPLEATADQLRLHEACRPRSTCTQIA